MARSNLSLVSRNARCSERQSIGEHGNSQDLKATKMSRKGVTFRNRTTKNCVNSTTIQPRNKKRKLLSHSSEAPASDDISTKLHVFFSKYKSIIYLRLQYFVQNALSTVLLSFKKIEKRIRLAESQAEKERVIVKKERFEF